jgi:hypothetical protein
LNEITTVVNIVTKINQPKLIHLAGTLCTGSLILGLRALQVMKIAAIILIGENKKLKKHDITSKVT